MSISKFLPGLRNLSIKWKLTIIIMAASTVALLLISAAFVTYEQITFRKTMTRDLTIIAQIIGDRSTAALDFNDQTEAKYELLAALTAKPHIVSACLYRGNEIYVTYPRSAPKDMFPAKPEKDVVRFEKDHLIRVYPVVLKGETIGAVYLKSDLGEMHDRMVQYAGIIILFVLASSAVTFFLSSLLRGIVFEPISHLVKTARTVSTEKNYSVRAAKHGQDELGQLIDVFNEMLTGIQERDVALQDAHDRLEKRVKDRTKDLQMEIEQRQRTQEELQQQLTRISLLNQITQAVSERQDLRSILYVVLRKLEDHLTVEMGGLFLFSQQDDTLTTAALQFANRLMAEKLDWREGLVMSLADSGLPLCKEAQTVYLSETGSVKTEFCKKIALAGINCAVAVPLMVEDKLFGILIVGRRKVDSFSSGECEFLRLLSGHVALAAHQARLHTQLQTAYDDLRQSQQAVMQQDRLRALGQMASGIAHDINNALSPVVGFAGLLLNYEPNLSQSARKHLNYIRTAGEDVAHIVARLREFYRKREEREPQFPLSLNKLAEDVVEMTRPRWRDISQGKGIMVEMIMDLQSDLPLVVGTESELREALTNLILNAVDAMPHGGKLTIKTSLGGKAFHPENSATHAILELTDTGTGMDENTLKHCFEPFFSTKGNLGTGMGLAMVYGVMERHEGKIEVESELGKGTKMRMIFPLREQPVKKRMPSLEVAPRNSALHILFIDDEPLLRDLLRETLEQEGHQVQVADSGQTGLDAFQRAALRGRPFDVVITDLGMPYLDGREVAKRLKMEAPNVPVIMLTGWGAFMKSDGEVPPHVDAIVSKPPLANELREILIRLTSKPTN